MTLESNKALVRQWIAAWMAKDLAALDALFAPDYTVNETVVGIEGVRQGVNFLHSILSEISAEANELVAEGDRVVLRWTVRGKHMGDMPGVPATGRMVELQGINIYQVSDGKIRANHEQTNVAQVLAGLREGK
jgi:steroid delta-isomerase-like uncharacterized protein